MKETGAKLAEWAIRKIEAEYKDDVCLLLEHQTLRLPEDQEKTSFSYFIPATSRAGALARTFIIAGIGYDLFPVAWERVERMADAGDYNTTVLADAEILWARTEDDRQRFASLQARLAANLQNPHLMYRRGLEWVEAAMDIYQEMLFEDRLAKVREKAGTLLNFLCIAVACRNGTYLKQGQTDEIKVISSMKETPTGFAELYERIIRAKTAEEQKRLCHEIIVATKQFLEGHDKERDAKTQRAGLLRTGDLVSRALVHLAARLLLVRPQRSRQRVSLVLPSSE